MILLLKLLLLEVPLRVLRLRNLEQVVEQLWVPLLERVLLLLLHHFEVRFELQLVVWMDVPFMKLHVILIVFKVLGAWRNHNFDHLSLAHHQRLVRLHRLELVELSVSVVRRKPLVSVTMRFVVHWL